MGAHDLSRENTTEVCSTSHKLLKLSGLGAVVKLAAHGGLLPC